MMRGAAGALLVAAAFLLFATPAVEARRRDLYREMNLTSTATTKEIKKMYQKWSRMLHPDVTTWPKDAARERMMQVTEAYEVLVDDERRETYDKTGRLDIGTEANTDTLRAKIFSGEHDTFVFKNADQFKSARDNKEVWMVMFWSKNFPECLEAGAVWNKFATRLKGVVSVGSLQCDSMMPLCRSLRMKTLPTVFYLRDGKATVYEGRIEQQSLVDFASMNLLVHADETIKEFTPGMLAYSTPIQPTLRHFSSGAGMTSGRFLSPQVRSSTLAVSEVWELLTFEYTDCMDCRIELRMAVESLQKYSPKPIRVIRADCTKEENFNYCQLAPSEGHAWRVAHGRRTVHYAPTGGEGGWTRVKTSPLTLEFFRYQGRTWTARQITNFVFELQKSSIIQISAKALNDIALKEATAWAVMFTTSKPGCPRCESYRADWEIMARITSGYISPKGTRLRVASLDCAKHEAYCSSLGLGGKLPALRMWRGGIQQKKDEPHHLAVQDPNSMLQECKREMEPLMLVDLDAKVYDVEVLNKTGESTGPANWFILYNAGSWCPPCRAIKQPWKDATRELDESPVGGKIRLAQVDCDVHGDFCAAQGIANYPTMHLKLAGRRAPLAYDGDRTGVAIAAFVDEQIDNYVVNLRGPGVHAATKNRREPVLVAFSAGSWCPPCTALKKKWKNLSQKLYPLKLARVDCDNDRDTCNQYGIEGYPTMVLYPNGPSQRRSRIVWEGMPDEAAIEKWARSHLTWFTFDPK